MIDGTQGIPVPPPQVRGGIPPDRAIGMSAYLLTNSELVHVETYVRAQGGQLPGAALIQQARLWCACLPPVFGVLTATALVRAPARGALWHALMLQALAFVCCSCPGRRPRRRVLAGSGSTMVIATFSRPRTVLLTEAWWLLAGLTAAAMWWAWRTWRNGHRSASRSPDPARP